MTAQDLPKPRSDSVLKTLSEERQHEIERYAREHGVVKIAHWRSGRQVLFSLAGELVRLF